jgi:hypothetical protein
VKGVSLVGCNQFFSLSQTKKRDALVRSPLEIVKRSVEGTYS